MTYEPAGPGRCPARQTAPRRLRRTGRRAGRRPPRRCAGSRDEAEAGPAGHGTARRRCSQPANRRRRPPCYAGRREVALALASGADSRRWPRAAPGDVEAVVTVVLLGAVATAVSLVLLQSAGIINWSFLGPVAGGSVLAQPGEEVVLGHVGRPDAALGQEELVDRVDVAHHLGRQAEPERRVGVDLGGVRLQRLGPDVRETRRRRWSWCTARRASMRSSHFSSNGDSSPSSRNLAWIWRKRSAGHTE